MNFASILAIVEDIANSGPSAVKLVKDVVTAINDLRSGKITQADFNAVMADVQTLAGSALGLA